VKLRDRNKCYKPQPKDKDSDDAENTKQVSFKLRSSQKGARNRVVQNRIASNLEISETLSSLSAEDKVTAPKKKKKMTPVLWRCLFIFMFMRSAVNVYYYGLTLSSNQIFSSDPKSRFLNLFYLGLTELPVGPFCYLLNAKAQRRVGVSLLFLCSGLPFLVMGIWNFIDVDLPVMAKYVFFLMGKAFITSAVMMVSLFMAEVFPTTVRTQFSGYCSGVARTFTILATLMPSLFGKYPAVIVTCLGSITLIASGLVWLLPETKDRKLPQTPSDLQTIHLETKSFAETIKSRISTGQQENNYRGDGMDGDGGVGDRGVIGGDTEPSSPVTDNSSQKMKGKMKQRAGPLPRIKE